MVVSAGLAAVVFPIFGKLCDTFDPSTMMPIAFLVRCFFTFMFWRLEAPNTLAANTVCAMMVIATVAETITIDTVFYKRLAKETRGVLCGAYSWAGQLGILLFSLAGGWLFDNIGTSSPFVLVGVLDFLFACLVIYCAKYTRLE